MDTTHQKHLFEFGVEKPDLLPVFSGRSFNLWNPDTGEIYSQIDEADLTDFLQQKRPKQIRSSGGPFGGMDADWAASAETLPMNFPRIAFRDIARATDTRTVIAALVPPSVGLVHTAPYLFNRSQNQRSESWLIGLMSSRIFDWFARRYVEQHLTLSILQSLPVPDSSLDTSLSTRLVENSGRLAAVDDRYTEWAEAVGVPVGSANDPEVKRELIAENDAIVAKLYGLSSEQLTVLFETFHIGWDYSDDLAHTLKYFDALEKN